MLKDFMNNFLSNLFDDVLGFFMTIVLDHVFDFFSSIDCFDFLVLIL